MNIATKIRALLREAELYRSQGLLKEALNKYNKTAEIIFGNERLNTNKKLIDGISKKVVSLKKEIEKLEQAPKTPEVSPQVQDLIKKLFSFSQDKDEDTIELDGAIALAKFGQYQRALAEFNKLIRKDSLRVDAAKNILRCHVALSSVDDAIAQYEKWLASDIFLSKQLDKLHVFFKGILDKEGIDKPLPQAKIPSPEKKPEIDKTQSEEPFIVDLDSFEYEEDEYEEDEFLDINAIKITINSGPREGDTVELNVNFQSGNIISLLIPNRDVDLIENLRVGDTLNNVEYYSAIAIFNGSGLISEISSIKTGPRRGDYNLDIKILDN
jgi:tetratricopeptide (TPR) repeat protein